MICRGGITVSGWGDVGAAASNSKVVVLHPLPTLAAERRKLRWSVVIGITIILAFLLVSLPGRTHIAPLVESDYCYLLTAADRLYNGQGLTATQPVAPFVPWEWRYDWGFLTQWPAGYPSLVAGVRGVFGVSSVDACRWIGLVACAAALAGWFAWMRRSVPDGVTGMLLAAVGAGSCVTVGSLAYPSTDAILVAVLPFILLLVCEAGREADPDRGDMAAPQGTVIPTHREMLSPSRRHAAFLIIIAGLLSGGLFWIRYASVFVPFAIGLYLLMEWRRRRTAGLGHLLAFGTASTLPIVALLLLNRELGQAQSTTAQLNLGSGVGFDFSWAKLAQAWWMFTDLGFYSHRPVAHWLYATWPALLVIGALAIRPVRKRLSALLQMPAIRLGACHVLALLGMLVAATTLFGAKFDYVGLERYYLPARPLYFLLFVTPLMLSPQRTVRSILGMSLLVAGLWIGQQEWARTYTRWVASERPTTPYGEWSRCFEPGAGELYAWLSGRNDPGLIVVSNFHEYIALETGIPALPIPPSREALHEWVTRIGASRGVLQPSVLFVLDPDNKWRSRWIPALTEIIAEFQLAPCAAAPRGIRTYLFEPHGDVAVASGRDSPRFPPRPRGLRGRVLKHP